MSRRCWRMVTWHGESCWENTKNLLNKGFCITFAFHEMKVVRHLNRDMDAFHADMADFLNVMQMKCNANEM